MTFYQIICDDQIIYDPRSENKKVIEPKLNLEVKKNGSLNFIIPASNPGYNLISLRKSVIKVYQITKKSNIFLSERLFRGCVYSISKDFYKRKQVRVEGELSFFYDSIVRPYEFQGSVQDYFYKLVNEHNAQVDEFKRFVPRNCTVTDQNNYITRANENYPSTKEEIENKLLNVLGGHLETEEIGDVIYIDYLADYNKTNSQPIVFGRNLLDLSEVISAENIKTRLIGLGAKKEDTGEYLKFDSINDGKDFVEDSAAINLFGICAGTVEFEDVTIDTNLLEKTRSELEKKITTTTTIDLKAADLHNLDVNVDALRCGRMTQIISLPHGLNKFFLLSKMSVKLDEPKSADIIFGATYKTLTEKQLEAEKKTASDFEKVMVSSKIIRNEVITNKANIEKTQNSVVKISNTIDIVNSSYLYNEIDTIELYHENTSTHYWITKVPYHDSNGSIIEIKHGFAKDVISTSTSANETPRSFAKRKNATLCINASIFGIDSTKANYKHIIGPLIHNGTLISNYNTDGYVNTAQMHVLAWNAQRGFKVYPLSTNPNTIISDGYTETVVAFDQLITNGEITSNYVSANYLYNWNILGVNSKTKDLYFFECNGKNINGEQGMTIPDICTILINKYNCDFAFRLDQGGSTAVVKNGIMLNQPTDESGTEERMVPDYIYFSKELKNYDDINVSDLYKTISDLDMSVKKLNLK